MRAASLALLVAALVPASAAAHQKSVSYSKWTLVDGGAIADVRVRWLELTSLPEVSEATDAPFEIEHALPYLGARLTLQTEAGPCEPDAANAVRLPAAEGWLRVEWRVRCDGEPKRLHSELFTSLTNHVHLATVLGSTTFDVVLSPTAPAASIDPADRGGNPRNMVSYLRLGVEHILSGWDHLAFLLLLIVVARRLGEVALLVTGFTVGHSM